MKVGDIFGILYSARLTSEGFQKFTVAHELVHYFLEGHVHHLFGAGQTVHQSESGFMSDDKYEREADSFAAGLLMPKLLFKAASVDAGLGLDAVEMLSGLCGTSLTATAIRYASFCDDPVAVVCSEGQRVQFAFLSKPLKDRRDLTWIRKGAGLPMGTATATFNKDPQNVLSGKRLVSTSTLDTWFDGGGDVELTEEIVGLGEYARTLTVLSAETLPEPQAKMKKPKRLKMKTSCPPSAGVSADKTMVASAPMPRQTRLRRVLILCRNFAANLAYYRVSTRPEYLPLQKLSENFWRVVSGNAIDICVLEWCKLFADPNDNHYWSRIVTGPGKFKAELLSHLGIDEEELDKGIEVMRRYRDKFLAHLDSDGIMNIPSLDIAKLSVWFYFDYVVQNEAEPGDLGVSPEALDAWHRQCEKEALAVYGREAVKEPA